VKMRGGVSAEWCQRW